MEFAQRRSCIYPSPPGGSLRLEVNSSIALGSWRPSIPCADQLVVDLEGLVIGSSSGAFFDDICDWGGVGHCTGSFQNCGS